MIRRVLFVFLLLSGSSLSAMLTGNPAQPALLKQSILPIQSSWCSLRAGYLDDWVYKQRFQDEFKLKGVTHTRTFMKLSTYAGSLTLNFKNRLDLYGLAGSSRMQIDQEIFTKRAFCWGVGGGLIFLKHGDFYLGADVKYFVTNQKPKYFVVDGLAYNIISNYRLKYHEIQGAVGMSYRAWIFAPYINATYILTTVNPQPIKVFVRFPDSEDVTDIPTKDIVGKKKWGMALGLTLVDSLKASLAFEWRVFNENAINVSGEIRF